MNEFNFNDRYLNHSQFVFFIISYIFFFISFFYIFVNKMIFRDFYNLA